MCAARGSKRYLRNRNPTELLRYGRTHAGTRPATRRLVPARLRTALLIAAVLQGGDLLAGARDASTLTVVRARSTTAMPPQLPHPNRGVGDLRAASWRRAVEHLLSTGTKVDDQKNAVASANATRVVTLRMPNGRTLRAIWKPVSGETATIENYPRGSPFAGDAPYPLKTLFQNEIRSAALAGAIGLHFLVPPTVERTIDGQRGSLQLFAEGATSAVTRSLGETLDRASAEKLRVFDYLVGNADRMAGNILVRSLKGKRVPVGIDGALSFPRGTTLGLDVRPFPTEWIEGHTGPLLASTMGFIRSVDPHTVARILVEHGAEDRQIAHTLLRLARLKRDSSFLPVKAEGRAGMDEMLRSVRAAAESREQGLPTEQLEAIKKLIARARGR